MPVGLGNAIRWLKYEISIIAIDEAEADVSFSLPSSFRYASLLSPSSSRSSRLECDEISNRRGTDAVSGLFT